jgi:hypothetical protein
MGIYRRNEKWRGNRFLPLRKRHKPAYCILRDRSGPVHQDAHRLLLVHFIFTGEWIWAIAYPYWGKRGSYNGVTLREGRSNPLARSMDRRPRCRKMDGRYAFDALFRPLKKPFLTYIVPYSPASYHPSGDSRKRCPLSGQVRSRKDSRLRPRYPSADGREARARCCDDSRNVPYP